MAVNDVVPQRYIRNPLIPRDSEGQILYLATELDKISTVLANLHNEVQVQQQKELIGVLTDPPSGFYDFTIPVGYDRITLEGTARSANSSDYQGMTLYYNNDLTTANYFRGGVYHLNGTIATPEANDAAIIVVPAALATTGRYGSFTITIASPDSSILKMAESSFGFVYEFPGADNACYVGRGVQTHKTLTGRIDHVSLRHVGGGVGTVLCYGEKRV